MGQDTVLVENVDVNQVLEARHSGHQVLHQLHISLHGAPPP
ncbi:hypothetical protein ACFQ9Q_30465 [Streptomyces virginiae]